jgi:putative ABC transport system permease protein
LRTKRRNDELDEELRAHIALAARAYEEQGATPAEAMSRARREFGNEHVVRERTRDTWGGARFEEIIQDVTYGLRGLRRSPGFTAAVLLSLTLGIGVNIAVFTLTDATLNRSLPFPAAGRIVAISEENIEKGIRGAGASPGNILDWREATDVFSGLAAFYSRSVVVTEEQDAEVVVGSQVTADFFGVFGVGPALGRVFTPEEIAGGLSETANQQAPGPVVVSDRFWKRRFGGSAEALGRTISLDGAQRQVIGVMPAAFAHTNADVELWLPWDMARTYARLKAVPRDWRFVKVNARLREGVSLDAAAARMSALASTMAARHPDTNAGWGVAMKPLRDQLTGDARATLLALLAAVLLVLLLTSANVANLQIARGVVREREMAVRLALGGSRPRLMRQLLTESLLLFALGGVLGVVVATLLVKDLAVLVPRSIVALDQLRVDGRVLAFALLITMVSGVCAGLLPAMRTAAVGAASVFRGARGANSLRLGARRWLVAGQVAIALVLVTGASLLVQSVWSLRAVDPGFQTADRLMVHVSLNTRKYNTSERRIAYFDRLTERLAAIPGVSNVSATTVLPMAEGGTNFNRPYWRADRSRPEGAPTPVDIRMVLPGYVASMGMRVNAGRGIEDQDGPTGRPVVMINERLARLTWPGEDPVGKQIILDYLGGAYPYEIVGVVNDTRHGLRREPRPEVFIPYRQNAYPALFFVVESGLDPTHLIASARQALIDVDPGQPAQRIITMEALVEGTLNRERLATRLFGAMALIAVLLSALGIWGIVDYSVSQSTRDIGLRMALGARPGIVLREVIGHSARLILGGMLVGGLMLWPLSAGFRSLLFGVSPLDPTTLAWSALLLFGAGVLSALGPSRRATRVDPASALRAD